MEDDGRECVRVVCVIRLADFGRRLDAARRRAVYAADEYSCELPFVMSLMAAIARFEAKKYVSVVSCDITGTLSIYIMSQMLAVLRAQESTSVALPHFYL